MLTNVEGAELSDARFAPFWAMAEKLGTLVVIHPAGFTEPQRLTRFYFGNVIGNPLDTTVALHYLIFDGVLERHPDLKILAVHGGGYLPAYSGRILMGTDYPYDMGEYNPVGHVAGVASFDAATVAAIAGENARRLLGL